ncbi:hypothetical protein [Streptomyces sp. NBC_01803]|uniref:hypothetical protein n=1 Tax=Streptomyces sp. NBC_01803 TaxID=2975946 RepID=UPI002DD84414|nr:hypothetical protein [Streptomyces sp. NBC_01803]WSA46731.1 hypothetical protein OIE51_22630 [Streptomyces sp. NBC_01803]
MERKLPLWVRDSALVVPVSRPTRTTYHVRRRAPARAGRLVRSLYELAANSGLLDLPRVLSLPGARADGRRAGVERPGPQRQDVRPGRAHGTVFDRVAVHKELEGQRLAPTTFGWNR